MRPFHVGSRRSRLVAAIVSAAAAGVVPSQVNAYTYTWFGAAPSDPTSGSYASLVANTFAGKNWANAANWSSDEPAGLFPGNGDTVTFPNTTQSAAVLSRIDRRIVSLGLFNTNPVDFDFASESNQPRTLEITSGGVLQQSSSSTVRFVGGVLNSSNDSQWTLQGQFDMYGSFAAAQNFTKLGGGELTLRFPSIVPGTMDIQEGRLTVKTSQLTTGAVSVGDSNGSFATIDWQAGGSTPSLRVGQLATSLHAGNFSTNELSLGLATVTIGNLNQAGVFSTSQVKLTAPNGGTIQGDNGRLKSLSSDIRFYGNGKVTIDTLIESPNITLSDGAIVVLQGKSTDLVTGVDFTGNGTLTTSGDFPLVHGSSTLSVTGNATAVINGAQPLQHGALLPISVDAGSDLTIATPVSQFGTGSGVVRKLGAGTLFLNNNVAQSSFSTLDVQAGVTKLGMLPGGSNVQTTLQVGTIGQTTPPLVQWTRAEQLTDTATITLNAGTLDLNGLNERVGGLTVRAGTIQTGNGTLSLAGNMSADLAGRPASFTGKLALVTSERAINTAAGTDFSIAATTSGTGLLKNGDGVLRLVGTAANTQQGTRITDGTLLLGKPAGTNATGSTASNVSLNIGDSTLAAQDPQPTVRFLASNQLPDASTIVFNGGTLDLDGFSETVAGLNVNAMRGSVNTRAGTLTLTGNSSMSAGFLFTGNLNLNGGERTFTSPFGIASGFEGKIDNGTFAKSGDGVTIFDDVGGTSILKLNGNNSRSAGTTRFAGLLGAGGLTITGGSFTSEAGATGDFNYSGALTGTGAFVKEGTGIQTFSGSAANTISGSVSVNGGTLVLNKTANTALQGPLSIAPLGNVQTLQNNQFGTNTAANVRGQLFLQNTTQSLASVDVNAGGIYSGTLQTSGAIVATDALLTSLAVKVDAGGLVLDGATSAQLRGSVKGDSSISSATSLLIEADSDAATPDLAFTNSLVVGQGAYVYLFPTAPASPAVLDIDGGLLIGTPVISGFGALQMSGTMTVDLSLSPSLTPGRYNLVDFSGQPYTYLSASGYARLSNFTLVPPNTPGSFSVVNRVLVYDAIPEPGSMSLLVALLALGRRRRA